MLYLKRCRLCPKGATAHKEENDDDENEARRAGAPDRCRLACNEVHDELVGAGTLVLEDDTAGVALRVDGIGMLVGTLPVSRGEDLVPASAGEGDVGALALGEALRSLPRVSVEVGTLGSLRGLDVVELIDELSVVQFVGVVIPD